MTNDELKSTLLEINPEFTFEDGGEWLTLNSGHENWHAIAEQLRHNNNLHFDYLFCLTCIDWKTHLTMVYNFTSKTHKHTLVVKVKLDRVKPEIETVCDIWRTAELNEREVYELFGVVFLKHPDLRKLLLTEEWEGWPLRKDYEDPVNMIKL